MSTISKLKRIRDFAQDIVCHSFPNECGFLEKLKSQSVNCFHPSQNLRKQVMTTNLWIEQYWFDYKLRWNPEEYGGVDSLHVPSTHIWLPDIVLYNK